jgi:GrpB-like predicted nucleotidyltransferase (UPF0157 family)
MSDHPSGETFLLHADDAEARAAAERLFARVAVDLAEVLPASAEIRHVGATAVAGCLTKGDLDVVVRVPAADFLSADAALARRLARNAGSERTDTFSSFEDSTALPHLGIQLTVIGSADDCFHLFAEVLRGDPGCVARYNALKRAYHGRPMQAYRAAKDAFVSEVLADVGRD